VMVLRSPEELSVYRSGGSVVAIVQPGELTMLDMR
jgi:hypothetical protein